MVGTAEPSCFRASDRQPCRTMQASIWKCGRVAAGSYPTRRARGRDACPSGRHRHARPDALRALALLRRADRQPARPPQYDEIVPAPAAGVARRHLVLAHCCSFPIRRRSPDRSKRKRGIRRIPIRECILRWLRGVRVRIAAWHGSCSDVTKATSWKRVFGWMNGLKNEVVSLSSSSAVPSRPASPRC